MATTAKHLNPVQVHLLRFFNEKEISEKETLEIQQLISNYYASKADKLMEKIWKEKKYSSKKND